MTKVREKIMDIQETRWLFWTILVSLAFVSVMYLYLVSQTVNNVIRREKAESNLRVLSSEVSELESKYVSKKNSVNAELAFSMGYKKAPIARYVGSNPVGQASVSLNVR